MTSESEKFTLRDGSSIGYVTCGSNALGHSSLFYFHGIGGSRFEVLGLSRLAEELNCRIICPERPGIGISTHSSNRKLLDYPPQIAELAAHLGISSYRILGISGGGPYALACAKVLPRSELKGVGIVAGVGPPEDGYPGARLAVRLILFLVYYFPWLYRWLLNLLVVPKMQDPDPGPLRRRVEEELLKIKGREGEIIKEILLHDDKILETLVKATKEGFRQGASGPVRDLQLVMEPWGFGCEDVDFECVQLWYGTEDVNTPVIMGRRMARRLKKSRLTEFADDTHLTLFPRHREEILKAILKD